MSKEAVFTMKLEQELRGYVEQRRQAREYNDYLRRKVETSRVSMRAGRGRSNDEVEAAFATKHETGQT